MVLVMLGRLLNHAHGQLHGSLGEAGPVIARRTGKRSRDGWSRRGDQGRRHGRDLRLKIGVTIGVPTDIAEP